MWWIAVGALAGTVQPESISMPGAGRHPAVFTVDRFGRYAIMARSPAGTAIQVVDAMTGPGETDGYVGERDGRIDLFLDRGRVQVVATGADGATAPAELRVVPFAEPTDAPRRLVAGQRVEGTLRDLEVQRWWIEVPTAGRVAVEASGRHLGELRLWRDGSWLVDADPRCAAGGGSTGTPEPDVTPGHPWTRCRLVTRVEPGLYLLAAYGAPGAAWAEASDAAPLEVRLDVPRLGSAGRLAGTLPASGIQRWSVPAGPTAFQLSLPDTAPALLEVAPDRGDPYAAGTSAAIVEASRRPIAAVTVGGDGNRVVTVRGAPGQPFTLTWFAPAERLRLSEPGTWFVSSVRPGDPADTADPTAVLYRSTATGAAIRAAAQGVPLDHTHRYERTFNLAQPVKLLLDVTVAGPYVAWATGTAAQLRIQPYLTTRPTGYQEPKLAAEVNIDLDVGLYVLELVPTEPGIATLSIGHDSWASRAKRAIGQGPPAVSVRPELQFPAVTIEQGAPLDLVVVGPGGEKAGLVARKLPLDPADPLPVTVMPGETLTIPIAAKSAGTLVAPGLGLTIDGASGAAVTPGAHQVLVRNAGGAPVVTAIGLAPEVATPARPLPAMDPGKLAALPEFPPLGPDRPWFLDLDADGQAVAQLTVAEPGLYVVESTGLLATRGAIRTRTRTSLAEATANGVGRNFAVAGYLGSGEYQVT
ncbi:MAG: hypothetical protein ABMB14_28690, partial [Myxococcota bacterium]